MSSSWKKGEVCGVGNCRSNRWKKDGMYLVCQNGHTTRGPDYFDEAAEDDEPQVGRQKHRIQKPEVFEERLQVTKARRAPELYMKSLQLILRHQLWFLIHSKGLPAELEAVVYELWNLRIFELDKKTAALDKENSGDQEPESEMESEGGSAFETDDESEHDEESQNRDNYDDQQKSRRADKILSSKPGLLDTLALCYLGMDILRLSITAGDIYNWTTHGEMLYYQATKVLNRSIREQLPTSYLNALDPIGILDVKRLHSAIANLAITYSEKYGIQFPARNHPLILFRYIRGLALPLEVYEATIKLAQCLQCDFAFPTTAVNGEINVQDIPEARLIGLVVVCVKLFYPFDGHRRHPESMLEPAATRINWADWSKRMASKKESALEPSQLTIEELLSVTESDVFTMGENTVDQYLDWIQADLVNEEDGPEGLYSIFPLSSTNDLPQSNGKPDEERAASEREMETLKTVHAHLRPIPTQPSGETGEVLLRPGAQYRRYRRPNDLPEMARKFYEEAAKISGLSVDMLTAVVFFLERRIHKWTVKRKRGERKREESTGSVDEEQEAI